MGRLDQEGEAQYTSMEEEKAMASNETEIRHRGIRAMPFIIGNEMFEKLGTWGTSGNLVVYFTTVFNIKHVSAAILMNVFNGTTFISPLIGGFLADAYFGRYKTLGFASIASLV
ncbi:hypothetical protein MKW94_027649, partial [Papaver nudicaule]|nr:hypothetical protein [Papaver nudicaule]